MSTIILSGTAVCNVPGTDSRLQAIQLHVEAAGRTRLSEGEVRRMEADLSRRDPSLSSPHFVDYRFLEH